MASPARTLWRRMSASLASQVGNDLASFVDERIGRVNARLDAVEAQLGALAVEIAELRAIVGTQVDVENQVTELFGRLLRSATSRIEDLEERVEQGR